MNLVDSLRQYFTPDALQHIGQLLSESPQTVGTALSAAVPAVLASLGTIASKPEGARAVMNAVEQTDESIIGVGPDALRGSSMNLLESGSKAASTLFGGGMGEGIATAISRFSGMAMGSGKNLVGMILPIVLAAVGRGAAGAGVRDATGLTSYFKSQASSIASAMPSGLQEDLASIPSLSSVTNTLKGGVREAAGAFTQTASAAVQQARAAVAPKADTASRVLPVVLLLAILGAIAWYLWPRETAQTPAMRPTAALKDMGIDSQSMAQKASAKLGEGTSWLGDVSTLGDPSLGKELTGTFADLSSTLSSVNDTANIDIVQTKLQDLSKRIDSWKETIAQLPPEKQAKLREMLRNAMPSIQNAVNKAMSVPGAQDKIGPAATDIVNRLQAYSQPPQTTM